MPEAMSRSPRNSTPHATPGPVWASTLVVCTPVTAGGVVAAEGGVVDDGSPLGDGVGVEALVELVVLVVLVVENGVGIGVVVTGVVVEGGGEGGVEGGAEGVGVAGRVGDGDGAAGPVGDGDGAAGPVVDAIGVGSAAALAAAGANIINAIGRATTPTSVVRALDPRGTLRK